MLGNIHVDKRPVLLLALEDSHRRLQQRMWKILDRGELPEELQYLIDVEPGRVLETVAQWMDTLPRSGPPPLIILDTLGKAMPQARRSDAGYAHDYAFTASLKNLVDDWPGAALVALHHTRKAATEDFLNSVSGTQGIAGAADTIIVLSRRRHENTGEVKVTGRDVDEGEYALTFTATGGTVLSTV